MKRLDFADIEVAITAAEVGSFEASADRLGISTAAVRQAIRRLEERESVVLFVRSGRRKIPTPACKQFLKNVVPALSRVRDLLTRIGQEQVKKSGPLRLVVDSNVAATVISKTMPAFLKRHPDITLDLFVSDSIVDLASRSADAGICRYSDIPAGMTAAPVGPPNRRLVVATPGYFAHADTPKVPDDLLNHNCLRFEVPGEPPRPWLFAKGGRTLSVTGKGSLVTNSRELLINALMHGVGLCQLDERLVIDALAAGSLVPALEDWSPTERNWSLYYPERKGMPASLRCFIDHLKELKIAG